MRVIKNDFKLDRPYRIIYIENNKGIKYKITQPFKFWFFRYSKKYYDVKGWYIIERYKSTMFFLNKEDVDSFIKEQKNKAVFYKHECVVFDSIKDSK